MWEVSQYPKDKEACYSLLEKQLKALLAGEVNAVANMANMSALLFHGLKEINWAGFYLNQGKELLLGPFQGLPACIRIPMGKGVCGTAAAKRETQLVEDVHAFPGHIACDSASRSELVIPLQKGGALLGVLDIDSPMLSRFDSIDAAHLEKMAQTLADVSDWNH